MATGAVTGARTTTVSFQVGARMLGTDDEATCHHATALCGPTQADFLEAFLLQKLARTSEKMEQKANDAKCRTPNLNASKELPFDAGQKPGKRTLNGKFKARNRSSCTCKNCWTKEVVQCRVDQSELEGRMMKLALTSAGPTKLRPMFCAKQCSASPTFQPARAKQVWLMCRAKWLLW